MHRIRNGKIIGAVLLSLVIAGGITEAKTVEPMLDIQTAVKQEQISVEQINIALREKCPSIVDIEAMAEEADGQWVRERITACSLLQTDLYRQGNLLTEEERQSILDNMNLSPIGKTVPVGYAVAVRRANVRTMPMGSGLFPTADDMENDVLQVGALDPCETVRLLHISQDKRFYFVQGQTMYGWVFVGDLAVAKKKEWLTYHAPTAFVTVISRGERIKHDQETVYAQMGTRLPFMREKDDQYKVRIPVRGNYGKLIDIETMVEKSDGFTIGYADYTADNIARLADAYVGAPYGYRGLKNSEDNIGMIADIYRAMGIVLPRDTEEMKKASLLLQAYDDTAIIASDGENVLAVSRETGITIIGKTADGKTIDSRPFDEHAVGGNEK